MTNGNPSSVSDKTQKTAVDEFMLSEYQTIAAAHFDLHNGLRQNFRFYLGLIAATVTVFAVYKDPNMEIFKLPQVMVFLFAVISVLGFLMFLNMINTRFDIILYTRTVNGVRSYFKFRAEESGNSAFEAARKLPVEKNKPPYNEGWNRAYTWLFVLIGFVNSAYLFIVLENLRRAQVSFTWCGAVSMGVFLSVLLHFAAYMYLSWQREIKEIPGIANSK